jgi:hypothetical protein
MSRQRLRRLLDGIIQFLASKEQRGNGNLNQMANKSPVGT